MKAPGKPNTAPAIHPGVALPAPAIGALPPTPIGPAPAQPARRESQEEEKSPVVREQPKASAGIAGIRRGVHPAVWASGLFIAFLACLWVFLGR